MRPGETPSPFGIQPSDAWREVGDPPPSERYVQEQPVRARQGHRNIEVPNLYEPVEVPPITRVEIPESSNNQREPEQGVDTPPAPPPPLNAQAARDAGIGNNPDSACGGEPGKDISVYLPANRNEVGKIVVRNPSGGEPLVCNAKGNGSGPMSEKKGDTPLGEYKTAGFGGNSKGTWGQKGIQLSQQWSGQGTGMNQGRGHDITKDLFLHTKAGLTEDGVASASSWGCIIVSSDCMSRIAQALGGSGANGNSMIVKEGTCQ